MPFLRDKVILLVSPQSWGKMFVSKHHYAIELAKYGNTVYFLNPPEKLNGSEKIKIEPSGVHPALFLIRHQLSFPYNIKFHFISLFHFLMKNHVAKILNRIGKKVDIVWSFDLGHLYPFRLFPSTAFKVFHPVDEPLNETAIRSAEGADIIFSVTNEILEKYKHHSTPRYFINHGVNPSFLEDNNNLFKVNGVIRVGFSGNLLRNDIDREVLLKIMSENPSVIFECWGSYQVKDANIGGATDSETFGFIQSLKQLSNVVLHGAVSSSVLAKEFGRMDAFLICYDVQKDQSKGTNYHKVMEYLGTGKAVISNNITTYKDRPELIVMVTERTDNKNLPVLFKKTINALNEHNSPEAIQLRKKFAAANTYENQLAQIEKLISANNS